MTRFESHLPLLWMPFPDSPFCKIKMSEAQKGPRVEVINKYIEKKLEYYKATVEAMEDDRNTDWRVLEEEFRGVIDVFGRKS